MPILWDNTVSGGSTTHDAIEDAYKAGTSINCSVTTIDAKVYAFAALITSISFSNPTDGAFTATVTVQPTGAETVT